MAVLALELYYLILDHLDDFQDRSTIIQYGLVCKDWLHSSRSRIFSDVQLNDLTIGPFFDIVGSETSLLPVTHFIRNLSLFDTEQGHFKNEFDHIRRLGTCPGVKSLHLGLLDYDLDRHCAFLGTILPCVSSLAIGSKVSISPRFILEAIPRFAKLESLTIHDMSRRLFVGYTIPTKYRFPESLSAVDVLDSSDADFFRAVLSLDPAPRFSSISIRSSRPSVDVESFLGKYIIMIGHSLRHLSLYDCSYSPHENSEAIALWYSTGLHSLYLTDKFSLDTLLSRLLMFLPFLRSPTLTKISIAYDAITLKATAATPRLWHEIDAALAGEAFRRLKTVVISWPTHVDDQRWEECLPLSNARGILKFECGVGDEGSK
ncbi:hypothetical protein MVEN_00967200 [Mycena venus]|uniref:Uncharacterized protein n=1 Tax=Mycena venus TaxID=2733690 RepID=A0A8H7CZH1_9AGAR|nr:hypothetical protein MVEN_00967200 [Mycena venus]